MSSQRRALAYLQAYFFVDQCDNTWNKVFTMLGALGSWVEQSRVHSTHGSRCWGCCLTACMLSLHAPPQRVLLLLPCSVPSCTPVLAFCQPTRT